MSEEAAPVVALIPGVDEQTASLLLRSARSIDVKRGNPVFVEGEAGGAVYLVTSGKVKITRETPSSGAGLLAVLGPGHVFGELSLLDGEPRSASAHALTDATLEELTQENLRELVDQRPEVAHWMLGQLARRLRHANDVVADLVFSDVPARVAQILVHLAEEFGTDRGDDVLVEHGLTQLELAQFAGAARESVNKALATFVDRTWVTLGPRSIAIHDLDALRRRS